MIDDDDDDNDDDEDDDDDDVSAVGLYQHKIDLDLEWKTQSLPSLGRVSSEQTLESSGDEFAALRRAAPTRMLKSRTVSIWVSIIQHFAQIFLTQEFTLKIIKSFVIHSWCNILNAIDHNNTCSERELNMFCWFLEN